MELKVIAKYSDELHKEILIAGGKDAEDSLLRDWLCPDAVNGRPCKSEHEMMEMQRHDVAVFQDYFGHVVSHGKALVPSLKTLDQPISVCTVRHVDGRVYGEALCWAEIVNVLDGYDLLVVR